MTNLIVSAAGTGAGKTLVARALCIALASSGRKVQPFKIGPDYIDGRLYASLCGRPAYNVDLWLDGASRLRHHVEMSAADADVALFEGMMGLFDGDDEGLTSSAEVARLLDAKVLLVLDGWGASQTLAAVALGLQSYAPDLRFAGAILNRSGGASHDRAVRRACAQVGIEVLAAIPQDPALAMRERRLGLDPADDGRTVRGLLELGRRLGAELDLEGLAPRAASLQRSPAALTSPTPRVRIAVAEDEAFWFTYPETLAALRHAGAEIVPFSPLDDSSPPDADGLWLSGGYPELYASRLSENVSMRETIRRAIAAGLPTYAECGGHMYLAEWLETEDGRFPMVGALAGGTSVRNPRLTIGYRSVRALRDSPLDRTDDRVRAYAFHYAHSRVAAGSAAFALSEDQTEGVVREQLLSSFFHRHFLVGDVAITRFVDYCATRA